MSKLRGILKIVFSPKYLFVTNTLSYGVLMGVGDSGLQLVNKYIEKRKIDKELNNIKRKLKLSAVEASADLQNKKAILNSAKFKDIDLDRVGRLTITGLAMGPLNHLWYSNLDVIFPGHGLRIIFRKIILDQIIASPILSLSFFAGTGMQEGQTLSEMMDEFKAKFWTVYKVDCTLWPIAQFLNFYFLPAHFRVIYVAVVTCAWNAFLSHMKHEHKMDL